MSIMNFATANQTFRQLLGNGLIYRVPPFQRDYSWGEDEWDDLWQDICGLSDDNGEVTHYMGYLVLQSPDSKKFDIIDGQQRITTISILILAALGHLDDLVASGLDGDRNRRRKDNLQNSYIGYVDPVSLVPRSKLELNRHNNRYYQTYLVTLVTLPQRGLNASEHLLRSAFYWFKDKLKRSAGNGADSGETVAACIDRLVDKLFFTVITVTDELNAFKVFETLNSRGVRLSSTDLLKNYLFSVISCSDSHETELKALEERWERIVGLLGSESFPEFLRVYWNSRYKLVRKGDLFNAIRRTVTTRESAFEIMRGLDQSAAMYGALHDPLDPLWGTEERQALQHLVMCDVRQPLALLLACYERFFGAERQLFSRILRVVAVISFRYNVICNLQTHEQERTYNEVAWKVSDGTFSTYHSIVNALRCVYPEDDVFKAAFADKELPTTNSRNRKTVQYILFQIEKQRSGRAFDFERATYNLEHILPENPSDAWSHIEESQQARLLYRLGNMTLLETKVNRRAGNGDYDSKRILYSHSYFQITQAISEHYNEWNESKIYSRQSRMADVAAGIWRVEFM